MIKPPLYILSSAVCLAAVVPVRAGDIPRSSAQHSVQGIADREIARRNDQVAQAQRAIALGDAAFAKKDYDTAVQQYKFAADALRDAPVTHTLRRAAIERYTTASIKLAERQIAEGNFAQAEATAKAVLSPDYNPGSKEARTLLAHLAERGYYNKTITPKFHAKIEEVRDLLAKAQGYYDSAQYQKAMDTYDQVLTVDPTNTAARDGQLQVDKARQDFAERAYDETRARMLWKVTDAWKQPIHRVQAKSSILGSNAQTTNNTVAIQNKLNTIIIPKVEFKDATVREAIEFLKIKSRELDRDPDPSRRGVNIVLQLDGGNGAAAPTADAGAGAAPAIPGLETATPTAAAGGSAGGAVGTQPITLSLSNVPMAEVLRYITSLAGLKYKIDPYAVAVVPLTAVYDTLITKEYKVPPGTFSTSQGGASASGSPATGLPGGGAASLSSASNSVASHVPAKDYFSSMGVQFPPGSSATFIATNSRLIVKNTQEQIELIDNLVEALNGTVPSQVDIEAKFVEITQTNLKELSFDISAGTLSLGRLGSIGTVYSGSAGGSMTSGNRSGVGNSSGAAISNNAIDSLLYPNSAVGAPAPTVIGVSGIFGDSGFKALMRALNQKKGVDLLSSPRVTCKSGQEAEIEIVREFKYATEYNPPQVPSSGSTTTLMVVTPTTPTAFDVKPTGVRLHVNPTVGADGSTIDLQLEPQVVEFEGFINYGTPIYGVSASGDWASALSGDLPRGLLTENVINQPIFSTRRVRTSVSVWDGQTVMLGGLMREDVQKVEDKVPFFGDMPLVGRFFRSSVDQHQKRNLMIFVTARLINPAGDPINNEDEDKDDTGAAPVGGLPGGAGVDNAPLLAPQLPMK
ncbi:MAG: Amuc_1098 family type IV pilus outer membrane protein [Chthoniobacteraceae bacterium]